MSESQNHGKTELDLSIPGQPANPESSATVIVPPEPGESAAGSQSSPANPVQTVVMDVASSPGGTEIVPPPDSRDTEILTPPDSRDTDVLPPPNFAKTMIGPTDQTLGDGAGAPADSSIVSVKGYRILGELGRGGMGVVYRARQIALNRTVALKMIIAGAHAGGDQLARFRAEAEAVAQLQHPNIVQVYDIGEQDGLPYFSLEFIDGSSLDKELAGKPQAEKKAAQVVETLARAMHYAHERNIIHRDLKPQNVLLTRNGVVKISDFGLAKQLESDSSQTRTGTIMGTPSYMAPEQGRGDKNIGRLADVYSLGSMLYEMISGRPPFMAPTALETLMRLLKEEPIPVGRIQPAVSRDLETICMKCLQKEPGRRYVSAETLADDLQRFQKGETILARPVGRPERAWRWCRRNPKLALLYGTVAVLVLAVAGAAWATVSRMNRDRAAIAETRKQGQQRLEQATEAVASGNFSRAQDLLRWQDPILSSSEELRDVWGQLSDLSSQIKTYADFRKLLDSAHYDGLFGGNATLARARETCHELIALYDKVESLERSGGRGWPPLNSRQQELLKEDIFEAFLIAAQVERDSSQASQDEEKVMAATQQAIDWLTRAEALMPPTKALYVRRGGYFALAGNKDASQADLDRAAKIEATSAIDRFWHAFADYLRAEDALRKGDKTAGNLYRLAANGFARAVEARPESFWAYFSWANALTRLGDGGSAVVGYTTCIQIRPDVPWTYNNRGTVHFQMREFDRAIDDFNKAVELNPDDPTGHQRRGAYYFAQKDFARASENFAAVLKLKPDDVEALRNRAIVSLMGRQLDESLADWRHLMPLLPKSHEPHYYVGAILLGRGQFDEALVELETALQKKPADAGSHLARAMIRRWQGKADESLADIDLVVNKLVPNRHDYIIERADLLRALGRDDEALAAYQQCLALQPKQIDGYLGLAAVYDKLGKPVLARECCDRMVKADPGSATPYLQRAEYLRQHGEFEAALADCAAAEKCDPKSVIPALVRAGITAARGDPAKAADDIDAVLAQAEPNDGRSCYAAACAWSLVAHAARAGNGSADTAKLAAECSDRAVQNLTRVVGECFHDLQYPEHNRMAWDPALEGVRAIPEVQRLLAGRK